jgi:lantibiotic modifying enzyme
MTNAVLPIPGKLHELSAYYTREYKGDTNSQAFSLLSGQAGIVLLQAMLYQGTKNEDYKKLIQDGLDHITGIIETAERPISTYCSGLAGLGWLIIYLNRNKIIDIDADEYLEELDELLDVEVDRMLYTKNFDILHGAMGLGMYFIKRNKENSVIKIIRALIADKQEMNPGIAWSRFDAYARKEYIYDFGLAHGMAGILYFLGKCYKAGIMQKECKELIDGCVEFFMNNIQPENDAPGSFFPNSILAKQYGTNEQQAQMSRVAWCYGDLGILHTLLLISIWLEDEMLNDKVLTMLLKVAKRRSVPESMIKDAGFCHGTVGNCYLFKNIYNLSGNTVFLETADYWLKQTLHFCRNEPSSVCGYLFFKGDKGWTPQTDILSGLGGIGIVLADYTYAINSDWNECFFLS